MKKILVLITALFLISCDWGSDSSSSGGSSELDWSPLEGYLLNQYAVSGHEYDDILDVITLTYTYHTDLWCYQISTLPSGNTSTLEDKCFTASNVDKVQMATVSAPGWNAYEAVRRIHSRYPGYSALAYEEILPDNIITELNKATLPGDAQFTVLGFTYGEPPSYQRDTSFYEEFTQPMSYEIYDESEVGSISEFLSAVASRYLFKAGTYEFVLQDNNSVDFYNEECLFQNQATGAAMESCLTASAEYEILYSEYIQITALGLKIYINIHTDNYAEIYTFGMPGTFEMRYYLNKAGMEELYDVWPE